MTTDAIRESLAQQLLKVTAERDELRKALEEIVIITNGLTSPVCKFICAYATDELAKSQEPK